MKIFYILKVGLSFSNAFTINPADSNAAFNCSFIKFAVK